MRLGLTLTFLVAFCGCSSSSSDGPRTDQGDGGPPVDSGPASADAAGPSCLAGEVVCGAACSQGADCTHAVVTDPPSARNVWVNGGTFVKLTLSNPSDVKAANVGDAVVAFRVADATHLFVEVPPGRPGPADITLDTSAGRAITRRALVYQEAPEGNTWTKKVMNAARGGFPAMATTFDDRVLVAGGYTRPDTAACTDTADLFDRRGETSSLVKGTMSTKRWTATATTLLTGHTVVAGSCYALGSCPFDAKALDLYDPATDTFSKSRATLSVPRGFLRNLRLADGRALFASNDSPALDVYDPVADKVTPVAGSTFSIPSLSPLTGHVARLRDGRVLIVPGGGVGNALFDPATSKITPTGDSLPQTPDALVTVGDGRVFAVGGVTVSSASGTPMQATTDVVSVFDPGSLRFAPWSGKLATSRTASTAVLGRDGRIYVLGGFSGTGKLFISCTNDADMAPFTFLQSMEVLDPASGNVTAGPALPEVNASLRSTVLSDGSILAGGGTPCGSRALSYPSVYFLEAPPVR